MLKKISIVFLLLFLFFLTGCLQGSWDFKASNSELIILQENIPLNLDPAKNSSFENALPLQGIYEGLIKLNPETMAPEQSLAESWTVSDDGKQWTFHLVPGIRFSDGTDLDAEAVKLSMSRAMNLKDKEPYAAFVFNNVLSIQAEGKYTVSFILKQPFTPFLKNLAIPFAAPVVSAASFNKYGDEFWKHSSGTGPYMLKTFNSERIVLQPNPNYHGEAPSIKKIVINKVPLAVERTKFLLNRKADIIFYPGAENLNMIRAEGMKVMSLPGIDVSYLGFYTNRPPFNNKLLRQVVAYTLDRDQFVSNTTGGEGIPASSLVPPPISIKKNVKLPKYSHEQARRILAREGYANGLDVTLITYDETRKYSPLGGEILAAEIKRQLEPAGIKVTIQSRPWEDHKKAMLSKTGDFFLYGWTGDNGDPDNFLYSLLSSRQSDIAFNASGYKNTKLDLFLLTAQRIPVGKSRDFLYGQAEDIVLEEVPLTAINHSMVRIAYNPRIQNINLSGFGLFDLEKLVIK